MRKKKRKLFAHSLFPASPLHVHVCGCEGVRRKTVTDLERERVTDRERGR